ncbi:response regulator [Paracoccus onubensis]|uniref:response regulator n=1 Tax=Paracoccus onubensis TaxID=1675788 RepID=UPI00272F5564|nr:response regulator [Paracoccus onubensis]MDP0928993.1 response regulator [Paracoccus onubensis]
MDILLLEDNSLLAECLSDEIASFGDNVIGPFSDAQEALRHVDSADAAILDVLVSDGTSFAVADIMSRKKRPFLFLTGHDRRVIPRRFDRRCVFSKPSPARPLLRDLHSRYAGPPSQSVSLNEIVLDMLAYARLKMQDKESAERLVEVAMIAAIEQVEQGNAESDLRAMLMGVLKGEIATTKGRHLQ